MRRGRRAGIAAAMAIAAAAAVTAGCGGGSSNALALDPVAAAATKTQDAGAARVRFALAIRSPQLPGGKTIQMRGAGTIDGRSTELTFRVGSIFRVTGIPPGVSPDTTMAQLTHASMTEILVEQHGDYVLYLRLGLLASQLPGGKRWIELDLTKLGKAAGIDLGKLLSGSQFQPSDLLSMLKAEGAKIANLGSAKVDGAATTHYRVFLDLAKALQAKGLTSPLLSGLAAQVGTIPEDVWIGKDGLVHRVRLSYGLAQTHIGMSMDLYDYGANVTIAAPPSSDVLDATQLAQHSFGSGFH